MEYSGLCLIFISMFLLAAGQPNCYDCVYMQAGDPGDEDNDLQKQVDVIFSGDDTIKYSRKCFDGTPDDSADCPANYKCLTAKGTAAISGIRGSVTARGCYGGFLDPEADDNACLNEDQDRESSYRNIIDFMFDKSFVDAYGDVCLCNSTLCNIEAAHRLLSCNSCFYVMVGESGSQIQADMNDILRLATINEGRHTEQCQDDMEGNQAIIPTHRACHYRQKSCYFAHATARLNSNNLVRDYYELVIRGCDTVDEDISLDADDCYPGETNAAYIREKLYRISHDDFGVSSDTAGRVCTCTTPYLCNKEVYMLSGAVSVVPSLWALLLVMAALLN